jgi:hypothetical protein
MWTRPHGETAGEMNVAGSVDSEKIPQSVYIPDVVTVPRFALACDLC